MEVTLNALYEKHQLLEAIADGCGAHIYVKDEDFRFVYGNDAVAATLRTTPKDMLGCQDVDFVDPEAAYPFREADIRVLQTGEPETLITVISVNGKKLAFEDRKFPITLPNGRKGVGGIAFTRDAE